MTNKYQKEDNIEMWHYKGDVWYQETTYEAVVGGNPYLYDSDWDYYGCSEVVCEFVLDSWGKEGREEVRELNKLLESGELEDLIETLKQNV